MVLSLFGWIGYRFRYVCVCWVGLGVVCALGRFMCVHVCVSVG